MAAEAFEASSDEEGALWQRALDNVLACALAFRLKELVRGVSPSELYSEGELRERILSSLGEALFGFAHHAPSRCLHLRCREEAIVVAVSSKEAKLSGMKTEEVEWKALQRLHEFLDGRS